MKKLFLSFALLCSFAQAKEPTLLEFAGVNFGLTLTTQGDDYYTLVRKNQKFEIETSLQGKRISYHHMDDFYGDNLDLKKSDIKRFAESCLAFCDEVAEFSSKFEAAIKNPSTELFIKATKLKDTYGISHFDFTISYDIRHYGDAPSLVGGYIYVSPVGGTERTVRSSVFIPSQPGDLQLSIMNALDSWEESAEWEKLNQGRNILTGEKAVVTAEEKAAIRTLDRLLKNH